MQLISIPVIIISFIIGMVFVYFTAPPSRVVLIYPTPDNVSKIQYKDSAENCYEFSNNKVVCPSDASKISQIPVQN